MKLPWWLRRTWQQAQRTVHEAEMSAAAYRARQAELSDEDREVIAAMRWLGHQIEAQHIVATSKAAPVDSECRRLEALLALDITDDSRNTERGNR